MQHKKVKYMEEIIHFADSFYDLHHRSPSCSEIAANTTLQKSAVHKYLVAMNEEGMIQYNGQTIMTPNIRAMQNGTRRIGIVGKIACGLPEDPTVTQDEYMEIPQIMVGKDEAYLLYATGESMIGAGIEDGDLILVRRQEEAQDGDIVVAYVEGEGVTLKRLIHKRGKVFLHPENPEMDDIPVSALKIQGKVTWIIKKVG